MVFDGQQINTQNQLGSLPRPLLDALNDNLGRIDYLTEAVGGSISRTLVATTGERKWFVKINGIVLLDMFEAEADGLRALAECPVIRVPRVVGTGSAGQQAYLILEHIAL